MRLEFLNQSVNEEVNVSNPLHSQSDFNFVPLFGLGLGYVLIEGQQIVTAPPVAGEKVQRPKIFLLPLSQPVARLVLNFTAQYRKPTAQLRTGTGPDRRKQRGKMATSRKAIRFQFEYGVRGKTRSLPSISTSAASISPLTIRSVRSFCLRFTSTSNIGDARYIGFEAATNWTF